MDSEAPCRNDGLSGIYKFSLHISIFNNPQIQYFSIFQNFKQSFPLVFIHLHKRSKNHPKILQNLFNQGLQLI